MGEARRRKLSGNYPEKTEKRKYRTLVTEDNDMCVHCNTRRILMHLLRDDAPELKTLDDQLVAHRHFDPDGTSVGIFEFGIVSIASHVPVNSSGNLDPNAEVGSRIVVYAFGEEVMELTPDGEQMFKPGAWGLYHPLHPRATGRTLWGTPGRRAQPACRAVKQEEPMGHRGLWIESPWGWDAEIDCNIVTLIQRMWRLGIKTRFSCENREGMVSIAVNDTDAALRYWTAAHYTRFFSQPELDAHFNRMLSLPESEAFDLNARREESPWAYWSKEAITGALGRKLESMYRFMRAESKIWQKGACPRPSLNLADAGDYGWRFNFIGALPILIYCQFAVEHLPSVEANLQCALPFDALEEEGSADQQAVQWNARGYDAEPEERLP